MAIEHDLHTFMAQVTDEMASEYQRIYSKSSGDPGTAGDEGEENWATLLREWLPPAFHVTTKGRLINVKGQLSPQVDVLVLKPFYPRKLLEKKVWLADGVCAVFECKTTLKSAHIRDSVERCKSFKRLYAPRIGSPYREVRSPLVYGLLAHSHSWKGENSNPVGNVEKIFLESNEGVDHPMLQLDVLCIADLATWNSAYFFINDAQIPQCNSSQETMPHDDWNLVTAFMAASLIAERQAETFRPISAMLSFVTQRLAWEDPSIRPLADYYRLANMWGNGFGNRQRRWPSSVLSEQVRTTIMSGRLTNGVVWDEWGMAGL